MDPLSAIGLASNIIAFMDLASKLISRTYEAYNSSTGTSKEITDLTQVIGDLQATARRLSNQVWPARTDDEVAVLNLSRKCQDLSNDIVDILTKLQMKGRKSKLKNIQVAWKTMREKGNLEAIEKRLNTYQM
jgi:hypothetical protein